MPVKPSAAYTLNDIDDRVVLLPTVHVTVATPQGGALRAVLGLEPMVVGTSSECDLVVADGKVSRRHCELRLTPRGIMLRDLGSKNGTAVGDVQIVEVILPLGVQATIGNSRLAAAIEGAPVLLPVSEFGRFGEAIGKSVPMRALFARLERAAGAPESAVLIGEPGCGKQTLARAMHASGPRQDGPFVAVRAGGVAPGMVEAELFGAPGAPPGAGAFDQAAGGTLYVDDLGELPLEAQPRVLAALEAYQARRGSGQPPAPRIIGGARRSLRGRVAEGAFREDLYRRLAVVEVRVPALRDRKEDIPPLVEHFLAGRSPPRKPSDLPPHTMEMLVAHDWPGNVRELRSAVARLALAVSPERAGARPPGPPRPPRPFGSPED
ncbi:MAG: sigma 54-interacting transcriptional regulator [Polyangiaceae bacterium]|nr:sigma 54-interacting transcriptional regulator [Polyangiaceae bacterium]